MDNDREIIEYYDELFPISIEQKEFYKRQIETYKKPVKILRIFCGTGSFEHYLAKEGCDVTGLETSQNLLESANRKRRTQLMAVRYFNMNYLEMSHFLGKKFYNVISILDGKIIQIHDKTLLAKFFYDCKQLLSDEGKLIIALPNFAKKINSTEIMIPIREGFRAKLKSKIFVKDEKHMLTADIETSNEKFFSIAKEKKVYLLTANEIQELANKAGFKKCEFYENFNMSEYTENSEELIAVIS